MTGPYYRDDQVTLWHGDMRQVLPEIQGGGLRGLRCH